MKKGFTLSETLITLTVLGVIIAVTMPLLSKARPDKDVVMYKKGLYTIQSAVGNATEIILNNGALSNSVWSDKNYINPITKVRGCPNFCKEVADRLNTSKVDCDKEKSSYIDPQIITTDGLRYWGLPTTNKFEELDYEVTFCFDRPDLQNDSKEFKVLTSVRENHAVEEDCVDKDGRGLRVVVRADGKVSVPNDNGSYEQDLIDRSFNVQQRDE